MSAVKPLKFVVITPLAQASYPNLITPREDGNGKLKYSMSFVFPQGTDLSDLKQKALAVLKSVYGENTAELIKAGKLHWPFRDAAIDVKEKGYPEGSTFISASSIRQPQVVNTVPDLQADPSGKTPTIVDPSVIYPGAWVKGSLDVYHFLAEGGKKKGVTFGLRNVQFVRDGERLDGVVSAQAEFEADPNMVAGLDGLVDESMVADADDLSDLGL